MRQTLMVLFFAVLHLPVIAAGQDSFSKFPGYENYQKIRKSASQLGSAGRIRNIAWADDGASMTYERKGEHFKINLEDLSITSADAPKPSPKRSGRPSGQGRGQYVGRAQQAAQTQSPDGKWVAHFRDHNIVLEEVAQKAKAGSEDQKKDNETTAPKTIQVTTAGTEFFRYGNACWVYGEELRQRSAMWWSPDSRKIAFYEMDERHMQNYYLTTGNTEVYTGVQTVRYPKSGMDNPYVGILVYDIETNQTTRIDVGGDRSQYVFNVRYTPDGSELLFNRTNRRQNKLEVVAANPDSGKSRVVVTETQDAWQKNRPLMQFLRDGKRFIWETERNGWKHYELRHIDGRTLNPLSTFAKYPTDSIQRVDEDGGYFYYTAFSDPQPLNAQLHRVRLDGTDNVRLTSQPLNHTTLNISPDHKWFVACYEAVGVPPKTALFSAEGRQVAVLAEADTEQADALGLVAPELFTFKSDDGKTDLQGILYKPAHFDPSRKYPLVVSVYGGPESRGISNRYNAANPYCEFGYLIATIANRGTTSRGKAFESATYMKLGIVDIQDQADGVRFLSKRPYVDAKRVGIYGHSYGGYMSALAVLKFPDVYHVGVAGAPVTDWKNYDTIYTERYMRTPQENPDGYRDGSCLTHAKNLKGKLLIMHGLIDDNVHPSNTWQLADLLQKANLRFDMLIYPQSKHGLGRSSSSIRWEYFHQHLCPQPLPGPKSKPDAKDNE